MNNQRSTNRITKLMLAVVLLGVALSACLPTGTPNGLATQQEVEARVHHATQVALATAQAQVTPAPPSQTPTRAPIPNIVQIPSMTLVFREKTDKEIKAVVETFVQENGGCNFPCLLGLSPKISKRQDVEFLINQLEKALPGSDAMGDQTDNLQFDGYSIERTVGGTLVFWYDRMRVQISLDYNFDSDNQLSFASFSISAYQHSGDIPSDVAKTVYAGDYFSNFTEPFHLATIFSKYGPPTQILVHPQLDDPQFPKNYSYAFSTLVIYEDQGFVIQYLSPRSSSGMNFVGCLSNAQIGLVVWNVEQPITLSGAAGLITTIGGVSGQNLYKFMTIEEATGMTKEAFMEIVNSRSNEVCIQTPMSSWLSP